MIPKIIHYCWFGNNRIPDRYQQYIEGWAKLLPDYEIKQWNETNFDVDQNAFTKEAYAAHNYAFVSDFVRCNVLYKYGGFYFDTDVEVLKSLDPFLSERAVLGIEDLCGGILTSFMGCEPNHPLLKLMVNEYNNRKFYKNDGSINNEVINKVLLRVLLPIGFRDEDVYQELSYGIKIYTSDYFSAYSLVSGKVNKTSNTYAIHWHSLLWVGAKTRILKFLRLKVLVPILGAKNYMNFQKKIKSLLKID